MPPQNPFMYDRNYSSTDRRYDPREGMWGRTQRTDDIELESEGPDLASLIKQASQGAPQNPFVRTGMDLPEPPTNLDPSRVAPPFGANENIVTADPFGGGNKRGFADMSGGSPQQTQQALAGLQAAQGDQFGSMLGDAELFRLANRDQGTVAPGANEYWGSILKGRQDQHAGMEGIQRKALEGISGAIAGTHPAVQFGAEQAARREAMPASITAQGQFRAAEEAANSRRDVAEAGLEGRDLMGSYESMNSIMDTIQESMQFTQDPVERQALENLYDALAGQLTGATFKAARRVPPAR